MMRMLLGLYCCLSALDATAFPSLFLDDATVSRLQAAHTRFTSPPPILEEAPIAYAPIIEETPPPEPDMQVNGIIQFSDNKDWVTWTTQGKFDKKNKNIKVLDVKNNKALVQQHNKRVYYGIKETP